MAVARRDQATQGAPARTGAQLGPALRPSARLRLVPQQQPALRPARRPPAGPDLRPGPVEQAPATGTDIDAPPVPSPAQRRSRPAVRRAARADRHKGSLPAYLVFLLAGAAVGAGVVADFLATTAGTCSGGDAAGNCVMQQIAAPALTRFAIVLVCAHGVATLLLDVLPDVRRKLQAGYRLRRETRPAVSALIPVGEPVPAIAAACWAPVHAPRTPAPPRRATARMAPRAVCPACVTIVATDQGKCLECHGAVVQRRG
ncbi:MAG: hypothetical protein JWN65_3631 [Solirubrobacterales bacterium]|nr:hypothetical protein [Solirubrobacterales bacterium]